VFLVAEENHDFSEVIGNANMPYCCSGPNSLQALYALATNYFANTHPSIGNYFQLTDGVTETNDDSQEPSTFPVSDDNLARALIKAGVSWKVYAEDLPSIGYTGGDSGQYAVRHNPFVYFTDVQGTAEANNVVPFADPSVGLAADLANHKLPTFAMIVPNVLDDQHDGSDSQADDWLKTNIDPVLQSPDFGDGLLIIWWDEGNTNNCTKSGGSSCGGQVALILAGSKVKNGYQGATYYQHGGTERLIYDALALGTPPGSGATSNGMADFFK
jgi:phosphatidylinositol-3-phosphatase